MELNKVYNEDCLDTLKRMPDEFINCVVTSPPYWGLRDYGTNGQLGLEKTPEEYVEKMVDIFREIKRVLKKDGTVWINLGDSYAQSGSGAGQNNSVKSNGIAVESFKSAKYLNQRNPKTAISGLKPKDLVGIPWRVAFALQAAGWYLRQDIIWHKPNPMPESVTDRCTKAHEYVFLLTKSARYWYDADAIRENFDSSQKEIDRQYSDGIKETAYATTKKYSGGVGYNNIGRNKRSVWTVTTQPYSEAHFATFPEALIEPMILAGCPEQVCMKCGKAREKIVYKSGGTTGRSWTDHKADLQKGMSQYDPNNHKGGLGREDAKQGNPYKVEIIGWTDCGCYAGFEPGIIYDPFMGAGTTAKVALRANRKFIGSELNFEYCKIGYNRIKSLLDQCSIFDTKIDL